MNPLEVLGWLILGGFAVLLVRALFRPWRGGGGRAGDPDEEPPVERRPRRRHDDGTDGSSDGDD
jgi:hypothetical protein